MAARTEAETRERAANEAASARERELSEQVRTAEREAAAKVEAQNQQLAESQAKTAASVVARDAALDDRAAAVSRAAALEADLTKLRDQATQTERAVREQIAGLSSQDVTVKTRLDATTAARDELATRIAALEKEAKGTVYLHSLSKEDLVFAVYLHNFATFVRAIDEVLSEALPSRQQLETILASMYGGFSIKQIQPLYNSINMKRFFEVSREQEGQRPWEQLAARRLYSRGWQGQ